MPPEAPHEQPRRRVLFPWGWIGLLVGGRLAFGLTDPPNDIAFITLFLTVMAGAIGVGFWYLVRGRGPLVLRLLVAASPFLLLFGFLSLFQLQHDGDVRVVGITWRGAPKGDELLAPLETASDEALVEEPLTLGHANYPRFLGTGVTAQVEGVRLATDWKAQPPVELWRRPIGAGWSSFAIVGEFAFTQEQRGNEELVVCYRAATGEPVWTHADTVRFDPNDTFSAMGGLGPRATPSFAEGVIVTHGATGIINCLDAHSGEVRWACDAPEVFGSEPLTWGNSSSPLLVDAGGDVGWLAIIAVGAPHGVEEGAHDASLVAFDLLTGKVRWKQGWRETSYASPIAAEMAGVSSVIQVNQDMVTAHAIEDGYILWEYPWPGRSDANASASQPVRLDGNRLLLSKGYGVGASLIAVRAADAGPETEPLWSPAVRPVLKTKLCNVVVHEGHAYGLDNGMLQCVEVETGKSRWKNRRQPALGHGQVLRVGEHLLVTSESGELVLVLLSPDGYLEAGALQVLGKEAICWNNPAMAGDLLLVRNAEQAVAYRLPLESAPTEIAVNTK